MKKSAEKADMQACGEWTLLRSFGTAVDFDLCPTVSTFGPPLCRMPYKAIIVLVQRERDNTSRRQETLRVVRFRFTGGI